jgi:hypothetical protein
MSRLLLRVAALAAAVAASWGVLERRSRPSSKPKPVSLVRVTVEDRAGRLFLKVDPWRVPVARNRPLDFVLSGREGDRMRITAKNDTAWTRIFPTLPPAAAVPPHAPVRLGIVKNANVNDACEYGIILETEQNGTIEIDPEIFICE